MKRTRKFIAVSILSLIGICVGVSAVSSIGNSKLPQHSSVIEMLSEADKIRLAESLHLRRQLGDTVFPG